MRDFNNKPYDIYIDKKKFDKISLFSNLSCKIFASDKHTKQIDMTSYTFKEVFEEFSKVYIPTKEEIKIEEQTHKKTRGKFSKSNSGNLKAAFQNCKILHDRIYRDLTKLDFQEVINNTKGCRSKLYNIQNLCKKLDEFALEKNIIDKAYAQFIKIDLDEEETHRKPYSYDEIDLLWKNQGNLITDILIILLYTGMRIEELLNVETSNIHIEEKYMVGGLKTAYGKDRIIPLHSKIIPLILNYYNTDNKLLFQDENGLKIEYKRYYRDFLKLKKELHLNHVIHETRHTLRSELDRRGANKKCMDLIMRS